jgi:hypothetical protein
MHYCCSELVDISFFNNVSSCEILVLKEELPLKQCSFDKETCCIEKAIFHEGSETMQKKSLLLSTITFAFINPPAYFYTNPFKNLKENIIPFKDYSPPDLITDIHVINNIFII